MRRRNHRTGWIWLALPALLLAWGPGSVADDTGVEFGIFGGVLMPDSDVTGQSQTLDQVEPAIGLRLGFLFQDNMAIFIDGHYSEWETAGASGSADTLTGRVGLERIFGDVTRDHRWFFSFGLGAIDWDLGDDVSVQRSFASVGFGQRLCEGANTNLRWELRADKTLDNRDGFGGAKVLVPQFLVGFNWGNGRSRVDTDGDGVYDGKDDCPDTPRGATVDEHGCPKDSDGDGVWDGIDRCPETPAGWPVDDVGCPRDSDGDGVADGADACPDTPRGAAVDERGCPRDSDGDGVWDGIDRCPDTPRGARVDERGCPKDSDGDGVWDGIDKCPGTPRGAKVDATGCREKAAPLFEEERKALVLEGVTFELNSAQLTGASEKVLDGVAASLRDWPDVRVEIGGHTDSSGSAAYNMTLSRRRAESVRNYLVGHGIAADRLVARGYGEEQPVADNATEAGRARNRRVELKKLD